MAEFTDVFVYRSEVLGAPLPINEIDGLVTVLQHVETLDPGTYTVDILMGCGQWDQGDDFNWRIELSASQISSDYLTEVTDNNDVMGLGWLGEIDWGGGEMDLELLAFISGAGLAAMVVEEAIMRIRRVA